MPASEPKTPIRILVIDDQETTRYVFRRILIRAGYVVEEASTGAEGLEKALGAPDLIIADVNLPDMLGYDLCRRLKANPWSASIPVLQISASFVSDESKVQALEGGADSYLVQPVEPPVLIAQVQALLRLRRAEALSHLSALQWQSTFDALTDGLALTDAEGYLVRVNRAFLRFLHLVHSDTLGKTLSEVFATRFGADIEDVVENGAKGEPPELAFRSSWFSVRYNRIAPTPDQEGGGILLITDITNQKKLQETLKMSERLAATGRLAHTIAHEINNPLEALANLLYLVQQKGALGLENQSYIQQASIELNRISQITKQILSYHRDSKKPVPVRTDDLLEGVLSMFRAAMLGSGVQLNLRFRASRLVCVHPGEMRQAFGNLIGNAIDAIGSGGGRLLVHCYDSTEWLTQARGVRVVVSDSGGGIPASARSRIFDAFYTTKELNGSGIGLWLTSEVIAKHHGRIRVRSRTDGLHRGTIFDVFLPEFKPGDHPVSN